MKMKLEQAFQAAQIVERLNGILMKNTATARKLFSLKKLLEPNTEFFLHEQQKIIDDLKGTVASDGTVLFANQEEGVKAFNERRKELFETEVDVPIDTPIIFRDAEGVQVSGKEIGILEGLAEFKE